MNRTVSATSTPTREIYRCGKSSAAVHRRRDTHRRSAPNRGFVLIATLWTLAAMAVLAAYIDGVASADIERAAVAKAALERELARRSTESTLAYLLSTGRMNHRGLLLEPEQAFTDEEGNRGAIQSPGVIAVSGETYAGPGGTRFSIQDENGLVSVNHPRSAHFAQVLSYAGVAPAVIDRIVPRAEDYVDRDDELSLSGAEGFDYEKNDPASAGRDATTRQRGRNSRRPATDPEPGRISHDRWRRRRRRHGNGTRPGLRDPAFRSIELDHERTPGTAARPRRRRPHRPPPVAPDPPDAHHAPE